MDEERVLDGDTGANGDVATGGDATPANNKPSGLTVQEAIDGRSDPTTIDPDFQVLEVQSLISGELVNVDGAITSLSDSWAIGFNEEVVYGRIDPIPTYSNTTRTISISLDLVPLSNGAEGMAWDAVGAQAIVARLAQMIYPAHESTTGWNGAVLKAPPLMQIRLNNVICGKNGGFLKVFLKAFNVTTQHDGLYSVVDVQQSTSNFDFDNQIYFNRLTLNFEFGVLHDFEIGHRKNGSVKNSSYPFNFADTVTED